MGIFFCFLFHIFWQDISYSLKEKMLFKYMFRGIIVIFALEVPIFALSL